jgi:hypothetical protein
VTLPSSSAAAAVTSLNVEPGGYVWRSARFTSGWFLSLSTLVHAAPSLRPAMLDGS